MFDAIWFLLEGGRGRVVMVCVAAAGVGTITVSAETEALEPGQEVAAFNIGSTVIVFVEATGLVPEAWPPIGGDVRVGQPLARWRPNQS